MKDDRHMYVGRYRDPGGILLTRRITKLGQQYVYPETRDMQLTNLSRPTCAARQDYADGGEVGRDGRGRAVLLCLGGQCCAAGALFDTDWGVDLLYT